MTGNRVAPPPARAAFIGGETRLALVERPEDSNLYLLPDRRARFEIFRADEVHHTSILFSGGDWRWQFRSAEGVILATSEGYDTEASCRAVVAALRADAASAHVGAPH